MKIYRSRFHQSGLTLLELLVVLSILAVLSTVALTSSSGLADQARYEATQRTLENIREAVIGPANQRDADGSLLITGFVADMGRLPRGSLDGTVFTLEELFSLPSGAAEYQLRKAETTNVDVEADADPDVSLATGWRGPYVNLRPGETQLRDGWGTSLVTPEAPSLDFPGCLLRDGGAPVTLAEPMITQIRSYGRDGKGDGTDYDTDVFTQPILMTDYQAHITVTVNVFNSDGTPATSTTSPGSVVTVKLFGPNTTSSASSKPISVVTSPSGERPLTSGILNFDPIPATIGARAVRAYFGPPGVTPSTAIARSAVAYLMVRGQSIPTLSIYLPPPPVP